MADEVKSRLPNEILGRLRQSGPGVGWVRTGRLSRSDKGVNMKLEAPWGRGLSISMRVAMIFSVVQMYSRGCGFFCLELIFSVVQTFFVGSGFFVSESRTIGRSLRSLSELLVAAAAFSLLNDFSRPQ